MQHWDSAPSSPTASLEHPVLGFPVLTTESHTHWLPEGSKGVLHHFLRRLRTPAHPEEFFHGVSLRTGFTLNKACQLRRLFRRIVRRVISVLRQRIRWSRQGQRLRRYKLAFEGLERNTVLLRTAYFQTTDQGGRTHSRPITLQQAGRLPQPPTRGLARGSALARANARNQAYVPDPERPRGTGSTLQRYETLSTASTRDLQDWIQEERPVSAEGASDYEDRDYQWEMTNHPNGGPTSDSDQ